MKKATLSIIMPNYNHGKFIGTAIKAIVEQSRLPDELIIIDDASTDNSVEIIRSYAEKYDFIKFSQNEENMGAVRTLHKLLKLVETDYLCGAAADDKLLPGFIEKSMNLLEQYPSAGLCSSLFEFIDENGDSKGVNNIAKFTNKAAFFSPDECLDLLRNYESWLSVSGTTAIYSKTALEEMGGFSEELGPYVDAFVRRAIALKYGVCFIPELLGTWRRMERGYSATASSDIAKSVIVIEHADMLMKTKFKDYFLEELANQTTNLNIFWLLSDAWSKNKDNVTEILNTFQKKSVFDGILRFLSKFNNKASDFLGKLFIISKLKLWKAAFNYLKFKITR